MPAKPEVPLCCSGSGSCQGTGLLGYVSVQAAPESPRGLLVGVARRCPGAAAPTAPLSLAEVCFFSEGKLSTLLLRGLQVCLSEEGFCIWLLQGDKSLWSTEGDVQWAVRTLVRREERVDVSARVTAVPSCCLWVSAATGQSRGGKGEAERSSGGSQVTSP